MKRGSHLITLLRNRLRRGQVTLALALLSVATLSPVTANAQFSRLSERDERELGRQTAIEVEKRYPVYRNRSAQNHVNRIGQRLARNSGREIPYSFKVLDLREVNAFALPGGYIYVNRGLLETVGSDHELAGVLAHEIAHVALRHSVDQIQKAQRTGLLLGLLDIFVGGRGTGGQLANLAGQLVGTGLFMKHSRDAERAADRHGVQLMRRSGYDPVGMLTFLHRLEQTNGGRSSGWFSSHPSLEERQRNISDLVKVKWHH